ncbi:MAG TPA: hypothetical protein VIM65_01330 [Cyclobacteriaceae bacterium]
MRVVLTIIFSSFIGIIYGQLKAEDAYITGEHFKQSECQVVTYPDWGHLIILSDNRFYSSNRNKGRHNMDTLALVGNYRIYNDTLYLTSIKIAVQFFNWAHKDKKDKIDFELQPDSERLKKGFPDVKFKITQCDDGQILLVGFADKRFWYAMKDPGANRLVQSMKENGQWEYLLR